MIKFVGIAAVLLAATLTACSSSGTVLTVNGQAITRDQLDTKLENSSSPVTARSVLQLMVTDDLIDQYAQKNNITVTPAEIAKIENQYKAQYPANQWDQLLKARGLSEQDVQDLIRRQIILDKAVGANLHIPPSQVAAYFKLNHAQLDTAAQARARHILVADLAAALKVEAALKAGQDFAAVAKQYSIDPGSKDAGGELGLFARGRMAPTFDAYVFSGPIGKISPPIKSPFGYHIIQIEERKPAVKATVANSSAKITQMLRQQQESPLIQQFLQQLQTSAKIEVSDQRFAGLFPTPLPAVSAPPAAAPAPTK